MWEIVLFLSWLPSQVLSTSGYNHWFIHYHLKHFLTFAFILFHLPLSFFLLSFLFSSFKVSPFLFFLFHWHLATQETLASFVFDRASVLCHFSLTLAMLPQDIVLGSAFVKCVPLYSSYAWIELCNCGLLCEYLFVPHRVAFHEAPST